MLSAFSTLRSLLPALVATAISVITLPTLGAQAVNPPMPAGAKISIFLADPQLGVVGAYQSGTETLYFEARTPEGSQEVSARLLDSAGRTIAITGHSMDSEWLLNTSFDAATAAGSLTLAPKLPADVAKVLDPAVFRTEIAAISALAEGAAQASPSIAAARIDTATANLPSLTAAAVATARNFDATAAQQLRFARDDQGNLNAAFNGVQLQAVVENFPDETTEEGVLGRSEVSARLLSSNGTSLIQQLGGDDIPDAWESDIFRPGPKGTVDPIQTSIEAGKAIRAAALMVRFPSIATQDETETISHLAAALRDDSLLPHPASEVTAASVMPASACTPGIGECLFESNVQVWRKPLIQEYLAEHSGSIVLHYDSVNYGFSYKLDYETIYCNHGTCPRAKGMTHTCTYLGPALSHYRYPPHAKIKASPGIGQEHSCYGTAYHLDSGFLPWDHPGHNCNDDTWTQIRAIRGQSEGPDSHRCNDWALDDYAPGCDS